MERTAIPTARDTDAKISTANNRALASHASLLSATRAPLPQASRLISNTTAPPLIQPKLEIGAPNDKFEREADRVADQVMRPEGSAFGARMPEPRFSTSVSSPSPATNSDSGYSVIRRTCAACSKEYESAAQQGRLVNPGKLCPKCRTRSKPLIDPVTPRVQRQGIKEDDDKELLQAKTIGGAIPEVKPAINFSIQSLRRERGPLSEAERRFFEPRFGDVKPVDGNVTLDNDPIHRPLIDEFRRRESELGNPAAAELSDAAIKYGGLLGVCPTRTSVDRTINITPIALNQGWRTAYGIAAIMRVHPGERTWDGASITESLSTVSDTCPPRVAGGACSGGSTFTVGASGRSARIGQLPGRVNRFYDFHVSKWRTGSLLHDRSRNPSNVDHCRVVCNQSYSCSGAVIGQHQITRNYRKGTHNGQDVTIINITKS